MTCCKRHLAATAAITLFVASATLYLNLKYTNFVWEDPGGGSSPLPQPISDKKTLERRSEEVEKHVLAVQKRAKLPRKSPLRSLAPAKNVSRQEKSRGAKHEWLKMVELERQNIGEEMKHYKFHSANVTLDSLIPERGGRPVRAVVRTRECNLILISAIKFIVSQFRW